MSGVKRIVFQTLTKEIRNRQSSSVTGSVIRRQPFHTSSGKVLSQQWKEKDLEADMSLPQVKVPDIAREELLTFKGMSTEFPCLSRK